MKKIFFSFFILLLFYSNTYAQLSGIKTIPGNYATIAAAITDLNTQGVGAGGVTFNVAAGHSEVAANLTITTTGTSANPIIFQKSGTGSNPAITAGTGTGTLDGVIKLSGTDYITFDRIDVKDTTANTTTAAQMEWGYAILKTDASDGCKFVTIKNCVINLTQSNTSAVGIYSANHTPLSSTALTLTDSNGTNSYNKFYSNIISSVNTGVWMGGSSTAAYYDVGNEVGTTGTGQSRIYSYGSTTTAYGVYGIYQTGIKIFNTNINNSGGLTSTSTLYGIFLSTGTNSNVDIYGDTVSVQGGGTTSQLAGIYSSMGTTGTSNTVNIYNNVIQNCTYTTATSAVTYYLYNSAAAYNLNVYNNKIINNEYGSSSVTGTGSLYYLYLLGGASTNNLWQVYNNVVSNNSRTQSTLGTGTTYTFYVSAAVPTLNVYGNTVSDMALNNTSTNYLFYLPGSAINVNCYNNMVRNITRNASSAATYCYYLTGGATGGVHNVYNNSLNNLNFVTTGATYCYYLSAGVDRNFYQDTLANITSTGSIYGVYQTSGVNCNINNNNIYGLNTSSAIYSLYISSGTANNVFLNNIYNVTSTGSTAIGTYITGGTNNFYRNRIYSISSSTSTASGMQITSGTQTIYNNFISEIKTVSSTSAPGVYGINITGGTTHYLIYNTIYLDAVSTSVTTFGSAGIYASTTPTVDMRNNIIVNNSTPGPTGGFTTAYQRSNSTLTTYADLSNNNIFYAGTPSANRVIYYDGLNADQTVADFQIRVAPRDANSFAENPPFINVSTSPYNLHINTTIPTGVESAATPVTVPIAITTDYDNQARHATAPDIGADEGPFTPGDLQAPSIIYTPLANSGTTANRTLVATITDGTGVQNTPPNDPRIYFKKGVNGIFKYRNKTSQSGDNYTFTIVVDSVGGLAINDTLFYYVAAQDISSFQNIGTNPPGGSGKNPPGTTPPPSPNYYIVLDAPLSGTYTIPSSAYPTIASAFNDLSLRGTSGPCIFNVSSGHTETAVNLTINIPEYKLVPFANYPITFQKSGSGTNPLITAGTGIGTMDAIIKLSGTDNIIFDGIDVTESSSNTTNITMMEWGYAILKNSGTDGCQNVVIKNCAITLNKVNTSTIGIYSANHSIQSTTAFVVTDTLGSNSYNKFYSNVISNVNHGIWIAGFASASPYDFYDKNNEVGAIGSRQNRIYNFGSITTAYGIYSIYQNNLRIFNTNINNTGGTPATSALYGIYLTTSLNSNADIYNDTLTLVSNGTTSAVYGLYNGLGSSGTNNTVNVYNNVFKDFAYPTATSASTYYIYQFPGAYNMNLYNNSIINNTYGSDSSTATGTIGYIYTFGGLSTNSTWQIYNNVIANNSRIQSVLGSGTVYMIYNSASGPTFNVYGNQIINNSLPSTGVIYGLYLSSSVPTSLNIYGNTLKNLTRPNLSTGTFYGLYHTSGASTGTANIYNNSINNINISGSGIIYGIYTSATMNEKNIYQDTLYNLSSSGGAVYGIYQTGGTTGKIYQNKIYNLSSTTGAVYGAYLAGGTTNYLYNNYLSDLRSPSSTSTSAISGVYVSGGTTNNIYYNTIYMNAVSSEATFGTAGIYASTTPTVELRNNIIVNVSSPGSTGGITAAYQRSSSALTTYSNASDNNIFYAGTPAFNKVIFYDGTNSDSTLADYKVRVAPRDAASFTENPPFVNVSSTPYDLHILPNIPTRIEGGALPITAPIAITVDYDNQTRNTTTPDIGADEGNFTPFILPPAIVNLKVVPGGFYNASTGKLNMRDTLRVYLVDSATCQRIDSNKVVLDSLTFSAPLSFVNAETGSYYIYIYHRNHIPIASRIEQNIVRGSTVSYDFTTDSMKAFGANAIKVSSSPVIWAMIPGDGNKDEFVDALDQVLWINLNGLDGYLAADFNGDLFVDGLDQVLWITYNGMSSNLPCPTPLIIPIREANKQEAIRKGIIINIPEKVNKNSNN